MIIKPIFEKLIMKAMTLPTFKYKSEIEQLIENGASLPPLLAAENKAAYRYVFSETHCNNHKPIYIQKPQRIISDADRNKLDTSGYALSCFESEDQATVKFESLKRSIKNIALSLGDSLAIGTLDPEDGMITEASKFGHFDLYEFCDCDLNTKFTVNKKLV